jgi:hypothetical protein
VVRAAGVAEHHAKDDHAHQLAAGFDLDRVRRPIELCVLPGGVSKHSVTFDEGVSAYSVASARYTALRA